MDKLFEFGLHFDKNKIDINTTNRIYIYNCIKEFVLAVNKISEKKMLDSEITLILSNIINKINNCLLNIISNNNELSSELEEIYYDFEDDLKNYGWKDNKFVSKLDIKRLKSHVNSLT